MVRLFLRLIAKVRADERKRIAAGLWPLVEPITLMPAQPVRPGDLARCGRCGSVFIAAHRCTAPPTDGPLCICGHQLAVHHRTETGRIAYCTVWSPGQCKCGRYGA